MFTLKVAIHHVTLIFRSNLACILLFCLLLWKECPWRMASCTISRCNNHGTLLCLLFFAILMCLIQNANYIIICLHAHVLVNITVLQIMLTLIRFAIFLNLIMAIWSDIWINYTLCIIVFLVSWQIDWRLDWIEYRI